MELGRLQAREPLRWEAIGAELGVTPHVLRADRPAGKREMVERLDPSTGDVILDLAAGAGVVGFSAATLLGPTGPVIVSDFAAAAEPP